MTRALWGGPTSVRWKKGEKYETPYGTASVVKTEQGGKAAQFKIRRVSSEAHRGGWRTGQTFWAHVNDQTSPSPRDWTKLT